MQSRDSPSFAVCVEYSGQSSDVGYLLHVRHSGGCEWKVSRRYQELLELHGRLGAVFGQIDLPAFPQRASPGLVGALLGQKASAGEGEALQAYFDRICDNIDIFRTQCLQIALAMAVPEPVSQFRVRGWQPSPLGQGLTALLDVRPEAQMLDSSAVTEAYIVRSSVVFSDASGPEVLGPVANLRVPAVGSATQVQVESLKPGAQVQFEVCAVNAVGQSSPVAIRAMVPARSSIERADAQEAISPEVSRPSSPSNGVCSEVAQQQSALSAQALSEFEAELSRRRRELEHEWASTQKQRGRADSELQEQFAELRAQREQLFNSEAEAEKALSRLSSPADGRSPLQSPRQPGSPGSSNTMEEDVEFDWIELQQRERELRASTEQQEAKGKEQRTEMAALKEENEELRRQRAELRTASEAAEVACAAQSVQFSEHQAQLARHCQEVKGTAQSADEVADISARLNDLLASQTEMDAWKAEFEHERALHEAIRTREAEKIRQAEAEVACTSEWLARTEQHLHMERQELTRSRANLAVVQAHVLSMLNKAMPESSQIATHRLDEDVDGLEEGDEDAAVTAKPTAGFLRDSSVDGIWSMDWASASFPHH